MMYSPLTNNEIISGVVTGTQSPVTAIVTPYECFAVIKIGSIPTGSKVLTFTVNAGDNFEFATNTLGTVHINTSNGAFEYLSGVALRYLPAGTPITVTPQNNPGAFNITMHLSVQLFRID